MLGSLMLVLAMVVLIYASSINGRFIWLNSSVTEYAIIPNFSTLAIFTSLMILLIWFTLLYRKSA